MPARFSRTLSVLVIATATITSTDARGQCPGSGECLFDNGTPGCNDAACCNLVCNEDPFCCNNQWDALCGQLAAQICFGGSGGCEPGCGGAKDNVECVVGTPQFDNRLPVGRILRFGGEWCTAWIVAEPNIVMTNQHCIAGGIQGMTVEFNYECTSCGGGTSKPVDTYDVTTLLGSNAGLDFALLQLSGNPAATWGVATVDPSPPSVGQPLYEIHHAGNFQGSEGNVKGYGEGNVTTVNIPGDCNVSPPVAIAVDLIATGGASGSPIFDANNHSVVAICHCGPSCGPGFAVPMSSIIPLATPIITNAGGTLSILAACPGATGDVNDDGAVDGDDIQFFVNAALGSGSSAEVCASDFSSNGSVGIEDVPAMITALMTGP